MTTKDDESSSSEEVEESPPPPTTTTTTMEKKSSIVSSEEAETSTTTSTKEQQAAATPPQLASLRDVFSYGTGWVKVVCLSLGFVCAVIAGGVAPAMIFVFARSFEDLVVPPTSPQFMDSVREMTYIFLGLGVGAFIALCGYATLLETSAQNMTKDFKQQWFQALLRQDMAYFDIKDVTGLATMISTNGARYKR